MKRPLSALFGLLVLPALAAPAPVPAEPKEDSKTELAKLVGTWEVTSYQKGGEELVDKFGKQIITFKADGSYAYEVGPKGKVESIDPTKKPKEINYVQVDKNGDVVTDDSGKPLIEKGIYKLDADTFSDCLETDQKKKRPTEFKATKENGWTLIVYKRVKKID